MGMCGVSAMVRAALWLEDKAGAETLSIGRESFAAKDSCTLESCGRHLLYSIKLDGGWVTLSAQLMDAAGSPESLLTVCDGASRWKQVCRLVLALERSGIKSLEPIELGETGPGSWVIA
jgi:hypothetical protein